MGLAHSKARWLVHENSSTLVKCKTAIEAAKSQEPLVEKNPVEELNSSNLIDNTQTVEKSVEKNGSKEENSSKNLLQKIEEEKTKENIEGKRKLSREEKTKSREKVRKVKKIKKKGKTKSGEKVKQKEKVRKKKTMSRERGNVREKRSAKLRDELLGKDIVVEDEARVEIPKLGAPPKLAPLPVMPAPKKGSPRSMYNTFLTEHFENAQITKTPFKPFDFASAFLTSGPPAEEPRSTEEMRADTLYKVQDDFEDMVLPPLKDIDHSLSYLRELDEQATQTLASDRERWLSNRVLKVFLNPLASTQPCSSTSPSPKASLDRLLITQTEEEEPYDKMKDPSRLKPVITDQLELTAPNMDPDEVTPRAPEWEIPSAKSSMALTLSRQRSFTTPAPPPSLVSSVGPRLKRRPHTIRRRLIRLKSLFSGRREAVPAVQHREEAGQN